MCCRKLVKTGVFGRNLPWVRTAEIFMFMKNKLFTYLAQKLLYQRRWFCNAISVSSLQRVPHAAPVFFSAASSPTYRAAASNGLCADGILSPVH